MDAPYTISDCAAMANVSRRTVERWVNSGKLSHVRLGSDGQRCIRIPRDAWAAWWESRTVVPKATRVAGVKGSASRRNRKDRSAGADLTTKG